MRTVTKSLGTTFPDAAEVMTEMIEEVTVEVTKSPAWARGRGRRPRVAALAWILPRRVFDRRQHRVENRLTRDQSATAQATSTREQPITAS
jgi:hypothetical protein